MGSLGNRTRAQEQHLCHFIMTMDCATTTVSAADLIKDGRPTLTSSTLTDPLWPHQRHPMVPWWLTTGPKKTTHPLRCQEHCKCGASAPAILTVMPNFSTPPPLWFELPAGQWGCETSNPPSHNIRPRWLAAATKKMVVLVRWVGGRRMGRPAAGWDSYWVFERWARSSHLPTSSIMPHKWT